jgi:8-oxo-dGTP pyrophosphatase MutT (NUDIX family)
MRRKTKNHLRYRTARAVLRHKDEFLLAIHSSFWARREKRWGLPGGNIERGEHPLSTVQRELEEELELYLSEFTEIGPYYYKGDDHMIYGADTDQRVQDYDTSELLDLRWFSLDELQSLDRDRKLHAGYELQAIRQFLALADH